MTVNATIRRVWQGLGRYTVIVEPVDRLERLVLKTENPWLASLAESYEIFTGRPTVSVRYEGDQLLGIDGPKEGMTPREHLELEMLEVLARCAELLDDYSDVNDGEDGQPVANRVMSLLQDVEAVLKKAEG